MDINNLKKRLHNVQGQLDGIIRMVESGKACTDILIQFKAARAGLDNILSNFLQENLKMCIDLSKLSSEKKGEVEKIILELAKA